MFLCLARGPGLRRPGAWAVNGVSPFQGRVPCVMIEKFANSLYPYLFSHQPLPSRHIRVSYPAPAGIRRKKFSIFCFISLFISPGDLFLLSHRSFIASMRFLRSSTGLFAGFSYPPSRCGSGCWLDAYPSVSSASLSIPS